MRDQTNGRVEMKTEVRTDRLGRKCKWWILADGRAFRSEAQALAAKKKPGKKKASKKPAPAARTMTTEEATLFALASRTVFLSSADSLEYSKAMHRYLQGVSTPEVVATLNAQWVAAQADVRQAANA